MKANHLGISCLPSKLDKAFAQLEELADSPEKIQEMGRNSRKLAKSYFSKELAASRLVHVLDPDASPSGQGDEVDILTA
jgi:UDP-N-acetylglucosamine:LPS N-acetylglucosamine transferase